MAATVLPMGCGHLPETFRRYIQVGHQARKPSGRFPEGGPPLLSATLETVTKEECYTRGRSQVVHLISGSSDALNPTKPLSDVIFWKMRMTPREAVDCADTGMTTVGSDFSPTPAAPDAKKVLGSVVFGWFPSTLATAENSLTPVSSSSDPKEPINRSLCNFSHRGWLKQAGSDPACVALLTAAPAGCCWPPTPWPVGTKHQRHGLLPAEPS